MSDNNRRQFLKTATYAGIGLVVSPSVRVHGQSANGRIAIACVGVGGKGRSDMEQAALFGDIVAVCDCDDNYLNAAAAKFTSAKKYNDYRKLFAELEKSIDAVIVSAPDHHHAPASVMAMRMGKHVYTQKPLTHTVYEARLMRDTARRKGVITQMGNQGTAASGFRLAVEVLRSGAIGPIKEIHVWTNRPVWPQAPNLTARPTDTPACPDSVHWEEFIGAAPMRPYHPAYHPFKWRGWWDFGTGALGDMACHTANMAFMASGLGAPKRIWASNGEINPETYPGWATVNYEFETKSGPVKFVWYEGQRAGVKNLPHPDLSYGEKLSDSGSLLVGTKGTLFSPNDYGAVFKLFPLGDFAGYQPPEQVLPRHATGDTDTNQKREWTQAILEGKPEAAMANFDYAASLTETILLGNIALRSGHVLEYDSRRGRITNCREADALLKPDKRDAWKV